MIWTGSWKPQSNSLVVCKAWGQGGVVRGGGGLWMNAARRWLWHAEYSCSVFLHFWKSQLLPLDQVCTLWAHSHTTPPVWLLKVFLYACDLDQTFLGSCAHHFAVIWHMRDSHTYTRYSRECSSLWAATQKIWAENNANSQMLMETPTVICLLHTSYQIPGSSEPVRYDLVPQISAMSCNLTSRHQLFYQELFKVIFLRNSYKILICCWMSLI